MNTQPVLIPCVHCKRTFIAHLTTADLRSCALDLTGWCRKTSECEHAYNRANRGR